MNRESPPVTLIDTVLFIDGEALVIDKPAGLPVNKPRHKGPSVEGELSQLRFGFQRPPAIVHRLDQDTSGCLLLARNPKALKRFNAAFEAGLVSKTYVAWLDGVPPEEEGRIELALSKVSSAEAGWRMIADPKGKSATTNWRMMDQQGGKALVEFTPETGRTHQLRVHAASGLGLPIIGDPLYGRAGGGMMLHASKLVVQREGKPAVTAEAPLPSRFSAGALGPG
jgi:tRNA pseudouridine32 synthase / 23S rRNA pseudouridine746 synthase